ncbi:MAG: radical SAM protein [Deltaproteobacteria bacterium]|nr:radical SAM protein [Deltaproteobacteria bacterium]
MNQELNQPREIAFGYSTRCNIKCDHCVAADGSPGAEKMDFFRAKEIIEEMAAAQVTGISFTTGEPLILMDDICGLIRVCRQKRIYTRVVTNGFWADTPDLADKMIFALIESGLSQLRISTSRWHQEHINRVNIVHAAEGCEKYGLDYFVSFITDFLEADDMIEQFLQDNHLRYFPEPMIYFGRADQFDRDRISTDYFPNTCPMNAYVSPNQDMYSCCDAANHFSETGFLYLGNMEQEPVSELFQKKEEHPIYQLIRTMGLTPMASYLGYKAREIVQYRKCELCEILFNSKDNLKKLEQSLDGLLNRRR